MTAVHFLPNAFAGGAPALLYGYIPSSFSLRLRLIVGGTCAAGGGLMLAFMSRKDLYWPLMFPGFLIGSFGMCLVYVTANVGLILSVPPSRSGVVGGTFNTALQLGASIGLAIVSPASLRSALAALLDQSIFSRFAVYGHSSTVPFRGQRPDSLQQGLLQQHDVDGRLLGSDRTVDCPLFRRSSRPIEGGYRRRRCLRSPTCLLSLSHKQLASRTTTSLLKSTHRVHNMSPATVLLSSVLKCAPCKRVRSNSATPSDSTVHLLSFSSTAIILLPHPPPSLTMSRIGRAD